jgi:hypothetical protein
LVPEGGFNLPVTISCTGAPSLATCNVSPSSVTPSGASASAVTVMVSTTARSSVPAQRPLAPSYYWPLGFRALMALLLAALGWRLWGRERSNASYKGFPLHTGLVVLAILIALGSTMGACGGGSSNSTSTPSNPGTPTGAYQLTVAATSTSGAATLRHSTNLTLSVN